MRRFYRRRELLLYRITFCIMLFVTICILIKGLVVFASDEITYAFKKAGVYAMQSIYVNSMADKNSYYKYVVTNETNDSNVITNFADRFAINYYAAHQNSNSTYIKENNMEILSPDGIWYSEDLSDDPSVLENFDEDTEHYVSVGNDLANKVMEENEYTTDEKSNGKRLEIVFKEGKVSHIENYDTSSYVNNFVIDNTNDFAVSVSNLIKSQYSLDKLKQLDYLIQNYYIVDETTQATSSTFDTDKLLSKDLTIKKNDKGPQILIYHTHASETYIDSRDGVQEDTVVGPGNYLAKLLEETYGYTVYHDKTAYDMKDGVGNRDYAYSTALPNLEKILEENPSIEVIIDLHRDSGPKRVTTLNDEPTAKIMLFNGLCRNQNGAIERLQNVNLQSNLAFSLQMNLVGRSLFPGLMHRIYLKSYRYNQHLAERTLLVELGTDQNTVQEAYNAMEPFAAVLNQVLTNR